MAMPADGATKLERLRQELILGLMIRVWAAMLSLDNGKASARWFRWVTLGEIFTTIWLGRG